jgi:branched-chain amino acid aminotransferase
MLSEALEIKVNRVGDSRVSEIDFDNIIFGRQFADHMFESDYSDGQWGAYRIGPYQPIMLSPSCLALHYGH